MTITKIKGGSSLKFLGAWAGP